MLTGQTLLLGAFKQRYKQYCVERKRCKEQFSEVAVHDLRIAVRRLLALIALLRVVVPHAHLEKLRVVCKKQLDSLDGLRDTQVLLLEIAQTNEQLPELAPLRTHLQKREKVLLAAAKRQVRRFKIARRQTLGARASLTKVKRADLIPALLKVVDDAYLVVCQRQAQVDPAQPPTIHRVRIAFKKFRYMLEIIHPVVPNFPAAQLDKLRDYQTAMGAIQDVEVLLRVVTDFSTRHKTFNPQPLRRFYEQRHADLIKAYLDNMPQLATFWRELLTQPFPWESTKPTPAEAAS